MIFVTCAEIFFFVSYGIVPTITKKNQFCKQEYQHICCGDATLVINNRVYMSDDLQGEELSLAPQNLQCGAPLLAAREHRYDKP